MMLLPAASRSCMNQSVTAVGLEHQSDAILSVQQRMIFFFFKCSSAKLLQHMTLDKLSNQVCQMESTKLMSVASLKEQKIKCPLCANFK